MSVVAQSSSMMEVTWQ